VKVTLFGEKIDVQHDLMYVVQQADSPENTPARRRHNFKRDSLLNESGLKDDNMTKEHEDEEVSSVGANRAYQMPRVYFDLLRDHIVEIKRDEDEHNVGYGEVVVSRLPQGRFKIFYLRPVFDRNGEARNAQTRLQRVGRGYEFHFLCNLNNSRSSQKSSSRKDKNNKS